MFVTSSQPIRNCIIQVPGSKSYTHRVLIAAALANGKSMITNALRSEDTQLTMNALGQMGVSIKDHPAGIEVEGRNGCFQPTEDPIFLGNSGTSMRLLMSIAALGQGDYLLTGTKRMQERPVQALLDSLWQIGVPARSLKQNGCPPLVITGGMATGTRVDIDCSVSSQFLSSLLLMAPKTVEGLQIHVRRGAVSRPYIDMTVNIMQTFGVVVAREAYDHFNITGRQRYYPGTYAVESDVSNASYFWAAGAITGKSIKVLGIRGDSLQGDLKILQLFEEMGCRVRFEQDGITVTGGALTAIETDMGDMPDMVPTVAVVASFTRGTTCIKNVAHLRAKECDRLDAVIRELKAMGIAAHSSGDDLYIEGGQPRAAEIETYDDHRIAMSFAVAGLRAPGTRIRNPACVEKSFPNFWEVYTSLLG
jgi:3-phosphoshikimate 1-carboxyvinyltransferase